MKYVNVNSGVELTEKEFNEMCEREYKDSWENDLNDLVEEFKEDGKSYQDYLNYMKEYDHALADDFEIIED